MITGFVGSRQGSRTWEERGFAANGKEPQAGWAGHQWLVPAPRADVHDGLRAGPAQTVLGPGMLQTLLSATLSCSRTKITGK